MLLKSSAKFIKIGADEANMNCAYLYFDSNDETWIKATGNPFSVRNEAHAKSAGNDILSSTFYRRYPSMHRNGGK